MKSLIILKEFFINFSDSEDLLNKNVVKNWFSDNPVAMRVSKNTYYEFLRMLNHFCIEKDGFVFKLDWKKIKEFFKSDKDFLLKLNQEGSKNV